MNLELDDKIRQRILPVLRKYATDAENADTRMAKFIIVNIFAEVEMIMYDALAANEIYSYEIMDITARDSVLLVDVRLQENISNHPSIVCSSIRTDDTTQDAFDNAMKGI